MCSLTTPTGRASPARQSLQVIAAPGDPPQAPRKNPKTMQALTTDRSQPLHSQPDRSPEAALAFARADIRWRLLSADRRNWSDPDRQHMLAFAFLNYHSARLALDDEAGEPGPAS